MRKIEAVSSSVSPPPPSAVSIQPAPGPVSRKEGEALSFQKVLGGRLRFSQHAAQRLSKGDIPFGAEEMARLERAVERAEEKGARESLVLLDDLALIVSIENRVVITAVSPERRKEGVFTNIDSVVLV